MYDYNEYYYEEDVINESALDMAMDMSERYGVAVEDAYEFAEYAMEGSLKDPYKRNLREFGRTAASIKTVKNAADEYGKHLANQSPLMQPRIGKYYTNAMNAAKNLRRDTARLEKTTGATYRNGRIEWLK